MKFQSNKGHRWTDEKLRTLMTMWAEDYSVEDIAEVLDSGASAIQKMIVRLRKQGVPLRQRDKGAKVGGISKPWTQGEVEYVIRRREEKATSEEIAVELGRTTLAVGGIIQKMRSDGVKVKRLGRGRKRLWSAENLRALQCLEYLPA